MNTSSVKKELRPYLPLLLEVITVCPVKRNNQLIPYEEVVTELEADTVKSNTNIGIGKPSKFSCGSYCYTAYLMLHVIHTLYIFLPNSTFTTACSLESIISVT